MFSLEIVGADEGALLRERVAGACCGSKLPRVYRPLSLLYYFKMGRNHLQKVIEAKKCELNRQNNGQKS